MRHWLRLNHKPLIVGAVIGGGGSVFVKVGMMTGTHSKQEHRFTSLVT